MRTTIEVPDHLLAEAKSKAALQGISLKQYFVSAIEQKLASETPNEFRREPPVVGSPNGRPLDVLTGEQLDEAMFG